MIYVKVFKKNTDEIVEEKTIPTLYDLENYISRVTSEDIRYNDYRIIKTDRVLEFFKRTYYSHFYVEFDTYIVLCRLYHSQKRLKNYRKKTNSNKILENTLERIQVSLKKRFRNAPYTPYLIVPKLTKNRYENIKVKLKENNSSFEHNFEFEFDKALWTFKVVSINTKQLKLLKIITEIFRYTTTPTKIYREKHKVLENENYIE